MDVILTNYPLTKDYQALLKGIVHPATATISFRELRGKSILSLIKYLRSQKFDRVFLVIEDPTGIPLLPILEILSLFIPAKNVFYCDSSLQLKSINSWRILASTLKLLYGSIASQFAVIRAKLEIAGLMKANRISVYPTFGNSLLYLNANLWFGVKAGGSIGHISGVVNAFSNLDYQVDFVSAGGRLLVNQSTSYTQLQAPPQFGLPPEMNHYRFHFLVIRQIMKTFDTKRFDFIYQRLSLANYSGVILSGKYGIPLILEYNGSEAWIAKNWGSPLRNQALAERVEAINLRHAHLVVTISDVLRDELIERGVSKERIITYPNCIDPEMFDPARFSQEQIIEVRKRYGISEDAIVVTFVGTFGQWHGTEVLAQAVRILLDEDLLWAQKQKVHFLFIGDGMNMTEVKQRLGDHANGLFVTLTGLVPQFEAPLYLAASTILCSPHIPNTDGSRFFGSPTKLFEYMAMSKAIIASDIDQIGEVLSNSVRLNQSEPIEDIRLKKRVALLVKPNDPHELARAVKKLAEEPELSVLLGQHARELALNRYTWEHHVSEILKSLKSTISL